MRLIVLDGSASRPEFEVAGEAVVIGRAPECDVVVHDQEASRRHARISQVGDQFVIEEIGAANRTVVNDRLLEGPQPLNNGDLIIIGRVLFQVTGIAPRAAPAPSPPKEPERRRRGRSRQLRRPTPDTHAGEVAPPPNRPAAGRSAPRSSAPAQRRRDAVEEAPPRSPREIAARLAQSRERLEQASGAFGRAVAELTAARGSGLAVSDEIDGVLTAHASLGGDVEVRRLADLLRAPIANQTDFSALFALGREARAFAEATRLAQRAVGVCLSLTQPKR